MSGEVTSLLLLTEHNNKKNISYFASHVIFHCSEPFHCCLSVVLWPEEGDFVENLHRVVYAIINISVLLNLLCVDRLGKAILGQGKG